MMKCYIFSQQDKQEGVADIFAVTAESKEEATVLIHEALMPAYGYSLTPDGWDIKEVDLTQKGCKEVYYG